LISLRPEEQTRRISHGSSRRGYWSCLRFS